VRVLGRNAHLARPGVLARLSPLAAAIALGVSATPAWAVSPARIVQIINVERAANGLPPVTESRALSAGNAQLDHYAQRYGSPSSGYFFRSEDPSKSGYTRAGAQAAPNSLLAVGNRSSSNLFLNDDWAMGEVFDNAPGHLIELMDPGVAVIGADQLDFRVARYGTVYLSSIDVRSAPL
jgi:hypothetical protein